MNPLPKQWKPTGYKLKSTKKLLEELLLWYVNDPPCCKSTAIISLWDRDHLREGMTNAQFSIAIHNVRHRLVCAYHAHYGPGYTPSFPEGNKPKKIDKPQAAHYDQFIGVMSIKLFTDLIHKAIKLPSEYCSDYYSK